MTENRKAAAAAAGSGQRTAQAQAQAEAARTVAAQVNFQQAMDAMAKLRATIDSRPSRIVHDNQED
jgi:hypothetical protein